jgi:hypothetical protein
MLFLLDRVVSAASTNSRSRPQRAALSAWGAFLPENARPVFLLAQFFFHVVMAKESSLVEDET